MEANTLTITPQTKVGQLLDAYPQLESVLLELSPAFAKLKNPVLRKTVARVASLQQAAAIGNIKTGELVNRLRKVVGQSDFNVTENENNHVVKIAPDWFASQKVANTFDATAIINNGQSPMAEILELAHNLKPQQILELHTPFLPAPILDMLKEKGYKVFALKNTTGYTSYIEAQ